MSTFDNTLRANRLLIALLAVSAFVVVKSIAAPPENGRQPATRDYSQGLRLDGEGNVVARGPADARAELSRLGEQQAAQLNTGGEFAIRGAGLPGILATTLFDQAGGPASAPEVNSEWLTAGLAHAAAPTPAPWTAGGAHWSRAPGAAEVWGNVAERLRHASSHAAVKSADRAAPAPTDGGSAVISILLGVAALTTVGVVVVGFRTGALRLS